MVAPFHEPMVSPVIVGRVAHLEFFDRILDDSRSGRGHTLLVSGEPGIGKSRLVSEGKRRAQHLGFTTLEGWCFETDRSLPYAPVADLLRDHISECPPELLAGRLGPGAAEFVQVLPELTGRLPGLPAPVAFEPGQERRRLFQAVAQLVNELTRRGPVLMLFEDLHWSDELSLELLLDLARRISLQPVLLLLTYRSDEVSPGLSQLLAELDRRRLASELVLSPLEPAEVEEMVRAILGLDRPPRSEFLTDLYALTEGNPFFVEEVLRSLLHTGEIFHLRSGWDRTPTGALPIPRSVHESVRRRSAGLTTRAGEALVLAAVAGRRFDFRLLRELLEADEQELVGVIKELMGAQLVVETSADHFAFRHALTREATLSGLLARERRRLHRIVGEGLERLHAGALEAHVSDLARHFHEAGVWEKVLPYASKAGERARALYAPHVAAEQLTLALEAAAHLGEHADPDLHRSRRLAYETLGEFERALADLEAALALARRGGDQRAEWQGLIDLGLLWAARDYARTGTYYREAMMLARGIDDWALLAQTLNWLGNWHLNVAQPTEGLRCHKEALAIFEELGDRRGLAETLDLLGLAANMEDNLVESVSHFRAAITLLRDLDDRQRLCSSLSILANTLGDRIFHDVASHPGAPPEEAVEHAEEALDLAREIEWRSGEAYALINLACCLGSRGEYGRGLPAAREALALAEEIGHVEWTAGADCALGAIHRDLLVADRAREHLERALTTDGAEEIYRDDPSAVIASAFHPPMQARAVDGGYRVTGRRPFSSNIHDATWLMVTALVDPGDDADVQAIGLYARAAEAEIIDTWYTLGMRGTDSNDVSLSDVFVPRSRTFALAPGSQPSALYGGPLYGIMGEAGMVVCPVPLGIAQAAVGELRRLAEGKTPFGSAKVLRERGVAQRDLARAEAVLRSARLLFYDTLAEEWERAQAGIVHSLEQRADTTLAAAHAVRSAAEAVDLVCRLAGTSGIYTRSPLERHLRDVQTLRHHGFVAESRYETAGQVSLGVDPEFGFVAF